MVPTPFETARLMFRYGNKMAEAQMVIGMRLWGMVGMWNVTGSENHRMVREKTDAMRINSFAVARAAMSGASPLRIAEAALNPVARRTGASVRRLSRRGPTKP